MLSAIDSNYPRIPSFLELKCIVATKVLTKHAYQALKKFLCLTLGATVREYS